jgi:hypothetical protein
MGVVVRRLLVFVLTPVLGLGCALSAQAQTSEPPMQTVIVKNTRDPVDKSYRKMVKGMDRFEREHALAPQAALRFRLLPRLPNADMTGITLRIAGDTVSQPITVAPDNSFALTRNAQLLREDAAVLANRKTASMTWRASIMSPGVPEGKRRLGDLRLECKVGMDAGLVSNTSPMFAWLSDALTSTEAVCGQPEGNYVFFTERPLFSVTLRAGDRSEVLPFKMLYAGGGKHPEELPYCDCQVLLDRSYYAPIWDASWPDDTLVEFEYMDESPRDAAGGAP